MCGCNNTVVIDTVAKATLSNYTYSECPYTKERCAIWLERVRCIKDGGFYLNIPNITVYQLNLYIGILTSVQNYQGSPCYFRSELEEIESFITVITSMELCLTQ